MTKALSIEFGAFDGGYSQDPTAIPVVEAAQNLKSMIGSEFGDAVDLTLIPYDGTRGLLGGGAEIQHRQEI